MVNGAALCPRECVYACVCQISLVRLIIHVDTSVSTDLEFLGAPGGPSGSLLAALGPLGGLLELPWCLLRPGSRAGWGRLWTSQGSSGYFWFFVWSVFGGSECFLGFCGMGPLAGPSWAQWGFFWTPGASWGQLPAASSGSGASWLVV